jgi:hypothetical protein
MNQKYFFRIHPKPLDSNLDLYKLYSRLLDYIEPRKLNHCLKKLKPLEDHINVNTKDNYIEISPDLGIALGLSPKNLPEWLSFYKKL